MFTALLTYSIGNTERVEIITTDERHCVVKRIEYINNPKMKSITINESCTEWKLYDSGIMVKQD